MSYVIMRFGCECGALLEVPTPCIDFTCGECQKTYRPSDDDFGGFNDPTEKDGTDGENEASESDHEARRGQGDT